MHAGGIMRRKVPAYNLLKLDSHHAAQGYVTSEGKDQSVERIARREL
jgi:hypothetical protein